MKYKILIKGHMIKLITVWVVMSVTQTTTPPEIIYLKYIWYQFSQFAKFGLYVTVTIKAKKNQNNI